MSEQEDKKPINELTEEQLKELATKLNSKISKSGARFTSIKKSAEGQYQLVAELNPQKAHENFLLPEANIQALVNERKIDPNSLLAKIKTDDRIKALEDDLYEAYLKDSVKNPGKEVARMDFRRRDVLADPYVDARQKRVEESKAVELYKRSETEYFRNGVYGTTVDLLSNFAATGFYNEIDKHEIKEFYDSWANDVDLVSTLEKIFHGLFKYGVCYVMPTYGEYEPHAEGISSIPGKNPSTKTKNGLKSSVAYILNEYVKNKTGKGLDFKEFAKIYDASGAKNLKYPVGYTILDPKYIELNSLGFFNQVSITLKKGGMTTLKALIDNADKDEVPASLKKSLSLLPKKLLEAAKAGEDYTFQEGEVAVMYLRKEDFDTYSKPRGARAFDSFDYKDELKKADYATVDGIYNYILKITVGDKDNPVTDTNVLESFAQAFNTPQKAISVVWNHTLGIEKITTPEVGSILGKQKYEPVDSDINAALGIARALIDGTNLNGDAANLAVKSIQSEIANARKKVLKWLYIEYKNIAKISGFNTYPVVKWKETVITTDGDAVTRSSYMQILDRKGMSLQTYMRELGLDYDTEVLRMTEEKPLIDAGILQAGSPFQKGVSVQQAPDAGRPIGQPTSKNEKVNKMDVVKRKTKVTSPSQQDHASEEENNEDTSQLDSLIEQLSLLEGPIKERVLEALTANSEIVEVNEVDKDKE